MSESPLRQVAHQAALYQRTPLAEAANALGSWRLATAAVKGEDEIELLCAQFQEDKCDCGQAECPACFPVPPADRDQRIEEILTENAQAIGYFGAGLALARLQVRVEPPDFEGGLPLSGVRSLVRLKMLAAHQHQTRRDMLAAAQAYGEIVTAARMLADCCGLTVHFLVAAAMRGIGLEGLLSMAEQSAVSAALRAKIDRATDTQFDAGLVARLLQSEFCHWALPIIAAIDETDDRSPVLERVLLLLYPDTVAPAEFELPSSVFQWPTYSRDMIRYLLSGHSCLWDAMETVRAVSLLIARSVAELSGNHLDVCEIDTELTSWSARFMRFHRIWPNLLSPLGCLAWLHSKPRRLARLRLWRVRRRLKSLANPLGMLVADHVLPAVTDLSACVAPQQETISRLRALLT